MDKSEVNPLDDILEQARAIAGPDANAELFAAVEAASEKIDASLYEVVIDPQEPWPSFLSRLLARLSEHLVMKRQNILGSDVVLIVLWKHEHAHLISSKSFIHLVQQRLGWSDETLTQQINAARKTLNLDPVLVRRPKLQLVAGPDADPAKS